MAKHKHEEHENHERWLVSYADFITLLFAFFVVMYSVSAVNAGKFRVVSESISKALNPIKSPPASNKPFSLGDPMTPAQAQFSAKVRVMQRVEKGIKDAMAVNSYEGKVWTSEDERGVVISVADSVLFTDANAILKVDARASLGRLVGLLLDIGQPIRVEGHTDTMPVHTPLFPSNWELSAMRAAVTVDYMVNELHFPADRISAAGFADARPYAENVSPGGREKNRRVDIVVLVDDTVLTQAQDPSATPSIPNLGPEAMTGLSTPHNPSAPMTGGFNFGADTPGGTVPSLPKSDLPPLPADKQGDSGSKRAP